MSESFIYRFFYPLYETHLRRRKTLDYYERFESQQWMSSQAIEQIATEGLQKLLQQAYHQTKYYKSLLDERGLRPEDFDSLEAITKLPILDKIIIRANFQDLLAKNLYHELIYKTTGGSTGEPLKLAHDRASYEWRVAATMRAYKWAGCQDGRNVLWLWSTDFDKPPLAQRLKKDLHNWLLRRTYVDAFQFDREKMLACLKLMRQLQPQGIVAYTNSIYNFARFIKQQGESVPPIEGIVTGAEKLYPHQRELIEEVFQTKVFNTYGCREFMVIAAETEQHDGLAIAADHLYVEILKDGRAAKPGEIGEVVVTDLHNYGMPFVRYKNGDLAIATDTTCAAGRGLPLLADVTGRRLDMIQTIDRRMIPGELFPHAMKDYEEILKFQVIQHTLETLDIFLVLHQAMNEDRQNDLIRRMRSVLGEKVKIRLKVVDDIPLTQTGKHRVTISHVPMEFESK